MISKAGCSVLRQARSQLRSRVGPSPVASLSALARLLSSLAVLEQKEGKLNPGSLAAVTAAQKLGGPVTAFIAGSNIKSVAEEAAKVAGIEKIIAVDNGAYDRVRYWFAQRKPYNYSLLTLHPPRDCQRTMPLC
jgi:electron transfer flavoprotein alpha subunit